MHYITTSYYVTTNYYITTTYYVTTSYFVETHGAVSAFSGKSTINAGKVEFHLYGLIHLTI